MAHILKTIFISPKPLIWFLVIISLVNEITKWPNPILEIISIKWLAYSRYHTEHDLDNQEIPELSLTIESLRKSQSLPTCVDTVQFHLKMLGFSRFSWPEGTSPSWCNTELCTQKNPLLLLNRFTFSSWPIHGTSLYALIQ